MRTITAIAAAACALVEGVAHAEVTPIGEGGFIVRHETTVAADAEATWAAVVEPARWWDGAHTFSGDAGNMTLAPQAGGCFCEVLPAGEGRPVPGSVRHMEVLLVDPGTALRMTGGLGPLQAEPVNAVMTVTLKPAAGVTRIEVEYVVGGAMRFQRDEIGPAVDAVIGEQVGRLARAIGVVQGGPEAIELPPSSVAEEEAELPSKSEPASPQDGEKSFGEDFLEEVEA